MRNLEILEAGLQSTVQDYPGRQGYQARGLFPAGPMDSFAFRAANLLVGNSRDAAGVEITLGRFSARFGEEMVIALAGATVDATLNGNKISLWESCVAKAGDVLKIGMAKGPGFRVYLAVGGGVDVPVILGSRATYTMGALGGLQGRALKKGDVLGILDQNMQGRRRFRAECVPVYDREWEVEVMRGPQADPDYLTTADMEKFLATPWTVGHNSNRVGIRLGKTAFSWARKSGGAAGGHPSNILDNAYPVGGINLNGDTPVILGPDGPTAGGFVVIATIVSGAMWKLGQFRPGSDVVRLKEISIEESAALLQRTDSLLNQSSMDEL